MVVGKELEGKERDEREEKFLIIVSFFICFHDRFIYITPKASADRCCVHIYERYISTYHVPCNACRICTSILYHTIMNCSKMHYDILYLCTRPKLIMHPLLFHPLNDVTPLPTRLISISSNLPPTLQGRI